MGRKAKGRIGGSGKKGEGTWRPFGFVKKLATQQLFPSKATDM